MLNSQEVNLAMDDYLTQYYFCFWLHVRPGSDRKKAAYPKSQTRFVTFGGVGFK